MVAAILADPDNDGPRQVYADWLQSRGDPLGEYIALSLAAEHLPAGDPQLPALWVRVREIECMPFERFRQYVTTERGMVSRLALQCAQLDTELDLRGTLVRDLSIHHGKLEPPQLAVLATAAKKMRLRSLRLEPYVEAPVLAELLALFPTLETLYIGPTIMNDDHTRAIATAALPALTSLTAVGYDRGFGDTAAEILAGSGLALRELALTRWMIRNPAPLVDGRLPLASLDLTGNPLGPAGIAAILRSARLPELHSLGIAGTGLDEATATALASTAAVARLRRLVLAETIHTSGLANIAPLLVSPYLARDLELQIDGAALGMREDISTDGASGQPVWSQWVGEIPPEAAARFKIVVGGYPAF